MGEGLIAQCTAQVLAPSLIRTRLDLSLRPAERPTAKARMHGNLPAALYSSLSWACHGNGGNDALGRCHL